MKYGICCVLHSRNPGAPQGSSQHRGDEVDDELDVYLGLLFEGSVNLGEEKAVEVRI